MHAYKKGAGWKKKKKKLAECKAEVCLSGQEGKWHSGLHKK